jgi:hypothetical protein
MTADRVAKELADILDGRATPARTRAPHAATAPSGIWKPPAHEARP